VFKSLKSFQGNEVVINITERLKEGLRMTYQRLGTRYKHGKNSTNSSRSCPELLAAASICSLGERDRDEGQGSAILPIFHFSMLPIPSNLLQTYIFNR
jgi:hypothetical protein